jgi:predicted dehydrogenase
VALKVGLIGCGLNGRFHSTAIRAMTRRGLLDIDYAAVCDRDAARARSFADVTGAEPFTDPMDLIGSEIDVVYICVPTAGHKELVIEAASRGKHIFCEKPLSVTLGDVREMVDAVDTAGVAAGVGLVLRHSPILTVLKDLAGDASVGRLMAATLRSDQFFPITGHYASEWRKDREQAGAGALLEHSIHDVDVLSWFCGDFATVTGRTGNFAGFESIEDVAFAHFDCIDGAQASLVSLWHSVLGRPSTRRLELFYEKGVFFVDHDFIGPILYQVHARNAETVSEDEVRDRYLAGLGQDKEIFEGLIRYSLEDYLFLRSVSEGQRPFPDFHVALKAHELVDAIYRSADQGSLPISL